MENKCVEIFEQETSKIKELSEKLFLSQDIIIRVALSLYLKKNTTIKTTEKIQKVSLEIQRESIEGPYSELIKALMISKIEEVNNENYQEMFCYVVNCSINNLHSEFLEAGNLDRFYTALLEEM